MTSSIICGYNDFNESHGYGRLKYLIGCLGVYAMHYYCKLEVVIISFKLHNLVNQASKQVHGWVDLKGTRKNIH